MKGSLCLSQAPWKVLNTTKKKSDFVGGQKAKVSLELALATSGTQLAMVADANAETARSEGAGEKKLLDLAYLLQIAWLRKPMSKMTTFCSCT